jgi:hypothetical protein
MMMRTAITIIVVALLTATASAEPQGKTFHDSLGREVGRAEQRGGSTIYLDQMGREVGRSERLRDGSTILYDAMGRRVGTERRSGGR